MSNEEYLETQHQVLMFASLLMRLDLKSFLDSINLAESAGPILDPTLYLKGANNLEEIKIRAKALLEAQSFIRKHTKAKKP